jgi:mannose-1-phosphate guanylyltransferase/mannose-6-phosphate isomerase
LVCNEEHRFLVAEQMREISITPKAILLEPVGRNTASALTLAAVWLERQDRDSLMLAMPADHVIQDTEAFQAAVQVAIALALQDRLVTFGIVPVQAETGYGYIKRGNGNTVEAFVEKPDIEIAQRYCDSGEYLWNSGIFLMRTSVWLSEIKRHRADVFIACDAAIGKLQRDGDFFRIGRDEFFACPSDSIDYAVMEKTDRAAVVPLDAGWSDIGAWSALWATGAQNADGNVMQGDVYAHATRNSLLYAQHRLLSTVGVNDLVVVETPDAVLVAHKDCAQDVKYIVSKLKTEQRSERLTHRRVHRPWGSYEGVDAGERFQVKRLIVNPGASLSLQLHRHRAEHWVVVKGTAKVTREYEVVLLGENQSTYIPIGTKHRLENPGTVPLEIIEVQSGSYLGEDDIVRFEDRYNRHKDQ